MGLFGSNGKGVVSVQGMFPQATIENILLCIDEGALVSLGLTRDRGALSVSMWVDGVKEREWFTDPDKFADAMTEAAEALSMRPGVPPSVKEPRKRSPKAP